MSARKRCFPPVVDADTRILLLGSLPGEASLQAGRYYAYPQNQFWRLLGAVLDEPLPQLDYPARLVTLLRHGVGLWDVIAEAERPGSLDAAIRADTHNDLEALLASLPKLAAIGFNGGTAARIGRRQIHTLETELAMVDLPSSSPTYTRAFEDKLMAWRMLQRFLAQPA